MELDICIFCRLLFSVNNPGSLHKPYLKASLQIINVIIKDGKTVSALLAAIAAVQQILIRANGSKLRSTPPLSYPAIMRWHGDERP